MNWKVTHITLMFLAGAVWILAGINVLITGFSLWQDGQDITIMHLWAGLCVFVIFFGIIFNRVYHKNIDRIRMKQGLNHPLSFFNRRSWMIMAFMIALGVTVRKTGLFPDHQIAIFYTGLALSLILTGIRYLISGAKETRK